MNTYNGQSYEDFQRDEEREYLRSVSDADHDRTIKMDRRVATPTVDNKPDNKVSSAPAICER